MRKVKTDEAKAMALLYDVGIANEVGISNPLFDHYSVLKEFAQEVEVLSLLAVGKKVSRYPTVPTIKRKYECLYEVRPLWGKGYA